MTTEEIVQAASAAGFSASEIFHRVAAFKCVIDTATAAEREACAITAWSAGMDAHNESRGLPCDARDVGSKAANAIRARNKE